jgi:hypothetical protein
VLKFKRKFRRLKVKYLSTDLLRIIKPHVDAPCHLLIQASSALSVFRCNCLHEMASPWEANMSSAGQEIRHISWNAKVHCRVHKNPPLLCTLWTRCNKFMPFEPISLRWVLILSAHLRLGLSIGSFHQVFQTNYCVGNGVKCVLNRI